jgi:hypothetical protein
MFFASWEDIRDTSLDIRPSKLTRASLGVGPAISSCFVRSTIFATPPACLKICDGYKGRGVGNKYLEWLHTMVRVFKLAFVISRTAGKISASSH